MEDKYSVLMSVYKDENSLYLKQSIDSMLLQTVKPDEIVLVKDGPLTVQLNEVINGYINNNPNLFTIVDLKKNVGLGLALNEGLKKCRNNLIARMDTDDISLPTRCEKQLLEFHRKPQLSIVGSNIDEFNNNPQEIISSRVVPNTHEKIIEFSKRRNPFNHPTVMYKKSEVLKCGGYHDFRRNQDYDLFVRMLKNGYKAKNINESLLLFRASNDNIQRRKSWTKTKSYMSMVYRFWRMGHSSFIDFITVFTSLSIGYILPSNLYKILSDKIFRETKSRTAKTQNFK